LLYFPLDNCCADRSVLQEIFGKDVEIKLDGFHGIQRICKTVKKKTIPERERMEFFAEVKDILRCPADRSNVKRTLSTPSPDCMSRKINRIVENPKWQALLPDITFKELGKLDSLHVKNACLR
jgi:hypothetical protein